MKTTTPAAAIAAILEQGQDPARYRTALAIRCGVDVAVIDAAIAVAGSQRVVDAETVAQERLAQERRDARTYRGEYRESQHEEE